MAEETYTNEVGAVKEDIIKLQSDLKELLHTVGTQSKEKLLETRARLETALKNLQGQAGEKFQQVYGNVKEHTEEVMEISRKKIEERPLTYVLGAFIAGILISKLIDRR